MKAVDYVVDFLIKKGITDVFGIPGGVVLDFLYALDERSEISSHLCYHEQAAAFAAIGYAQASNKTGVAYSTRGPGFTNMITAIADAYFDSIPVIFITGHSCDIKNKKMRVEFDQELETNNMVKNITKYAAFVNSEKDLPKELEKAYKFANENRKGPVLLNISSKIWQKEIQQTKKRSEYLKTQNYTSIISRIEKELKKSSRPIILVGDGINQTYTKEALKTFVENNQIPVLSSRCSSNLLSGNDLYFGYIGSHGIREANFILSKADLIISLGNRMSYPVNSKSFSKISAKIIRIDIDETEFKRKIPNSICYKADLTNFMKQLALNKFIYKQSKNWISICNYIKKELSYFDANEEVDTVIKILNTLNKDNVIVSDVGNNEFFLSMASYISEIENRILYSKSFGTLGCAIPKSIGTYYATKQDVICFTGDQGFQFNIQDLQTIVKNDISVLIVLLNNHSSGMILDREKRTNKSKYLHTTYDDGYSNPNFKSLAKSWGLNYYDEIQKEYKKPAILEININKIIHLEPFLESGEFCQNLSPKINENLYTKLNSL